MRNARRDDHHVAGRDPPTLAPKNGPPPIASADDPGIRIIRWHAVGIDQRSPGDERAGAVQHTDDGTDPLELQPW